MEIKKPEKAAPARELVPAAEFGWPFPAFRRFGHEFDWLFDRLGMGRLMPMTEPTETFWTPNVEVFEKEKEFIVRAELPGLTKEEITTELVENELILRGERKREKEEKREGYYRSERSYGSFYRAIPLPEGVSVEKATATMKNGVLEVRMPLAEVERNHRRLEIKEPEATEKVKAVA